MMKTGLAKKLAILLLAFAAAAATCFGAASLNGSVSGVNAETAYEATYLTGFRSNDATVMHFYWRIDGADLGYAANQELAKIDVNYISGGATETRRIILQYTTASTQGVTGDLGGTSDRRQGNGSPVAATHPCIFITVSPSAQSGDSFTIPSGTVIGNKYRLTQDYTVTFNGKNWLFTEESAIPLEITGFRTGGANAVYLYGGKVLDGYYFKDITLSKSVTLDYIPAGGTQTTKTGATIKPETVTCVNNAHINTSAMLLSWNGNCNEGDVIVLKKGTKLDNFVLTRDYNLTKTASGWICELSPGEGDEELNLTLRGGLVSQLNLFCDETMNFDYVSDEQLSTAAVVYKNDEAIVAAVNALAKSGNKPSFCLKTATAFQSGDIVKVPAGFVVAGYKTNKDYMFKWDGTKWAAVVCDGVHHKFADEFTCHERVCICGFVSPATTDHKFEQGSYPCEARVCLDCKETVEGVGHEWVGENCEKTCSVCKKQAGVHEWDDGVVTVPSTCKEAGIKTFTCTKCSETKTESVPKSAHTIAEGAKTCSVCGYRIRYTAEDINEILASGKLAEYTYADFHADDDLSEKGHIYNEYTDGVKYGNTYLLNTTKNADKSYKYDEGHEEYADMKVGFSLIVNSWAASGRSGYVYLAAHENGSWGIGFMFTLVDGNPNLRFVYRSSDNGRIEFTKGNTLDISLGEKNYYELGVIKNDDGSIFVFAIVNDELFMSETLTTEILETYKNAATHDGIGGAASFVFNGSAAAPSISGIICDREHKYPEEMYDCKDYSCEICGTEKTHTAEHKWGDAVLEKSGDCENKDVWSSTCSVCGEKTVYDGDLRHDWDEENAFIVRKRSCGGVDEIVRYTCKKCNAKSGDIILEGTGAEGAHEYESTVIKEATCTEKGLEQEVCSKCGDEKAAAETPVDENNHKHVEAVSGKPATATETGIKDHFVCKDCGKKLLKNGDSYTEATDEDLIIPVEEKGGCASGISSASLFLPVSVLAVALAVILKKKKSVRK